jgi:uncharacterized repeat protein (TIGR04076 family)
MEKKKNEKNKTEKRWKKFQEHLNYSDEELVIHRSNPKHVRAMEAAPRFVTHIVLIEVIEACNCGAGYKAGDKFVVDGEGLLVVDQCPPRLCVAAVASIKSLVDRMWQAFYNDSDDVLHDTINCTDVGVQRGGWGQITMRVRAVKKEKRPQKSAAG